MKINTNGNSKIFINTVYIPPWAAFEHVNAYYEHIAHTINTKEPYARYILLGDFNLPSIDWFSNGDHQLALRYEGRFANELINMLTTCNLTQKNGIKINGRSLDLVISNVDMVVKRIDERNLIIKEDRGHPALDLKINKSDIKFLHSIKTEKINFFNANYEQINDEIRQIDWHSALQSHNIDEAVNIFYDKIHTIINRNAHIIRPKSDLYPKWYSTNLIQMIKDKNYYRNKMKAANGEFYVTLFQSKRKEIKKEKTHA